MVSAFSSPQATQTIINEPSSAAKKTPLVSEAMQTDEDDDPLEDVIGVPAPTATKVPTLDATPVAKEKLASELNVNSITEEVAAGRYAPVHVLLVTRRQRK